MTYYDSKIGKVIFLPFRVRMLDANMQTKSIRLMGKHGFPITPFGNDCLLGQYIN